MKYQTQNGWTKESMIEHVKKEFKGKSVDRDNANRCLYRGADDAKCAVGMFIPEESYVSQMDTACGPASELFYNMPWVLNYMPLNELAMGYIQMVHDNSQPDSTLELMLQWIEDNVE